MKTFKYLYNLSIPRILTVGNFVSFFMCLYMYVFVLQLLSGNSLYTYIMLLLAAIIGFLGLFKTYISVDLIYFQIMIITFVVVIILTTIKGQPISFAFIFVSNGLIAYSIINNRLNSRFFYINFLLISAIFILHMINGANPNLLLFSGSRNVISFIIMFNLFLLHFVEFVNKKNISFFPIVIFVVVSIWCVGRTGIFCALIYFFSVILYKMYFFSLRKKIILLLLFLSLIIYFGGLYFEELNFLYNFYFQRIIQNGISYSEDPRSLMLKEYLGRINPYTFFLGYNYYNQGYIGSRFDNNPHNSFVCFYREKGI